MSPRDLALAKMVVEWCAETCHGLRTTYIGKDPMDAARRLANDDAWFAIRALLLNTESLPVDRLPEDRDGERWRSLFTIERLVFGMIAPEDWPERKYFFTQFDTEEEAAAAVDVAIAKEPK